jgi:carboxyl-terminal processing protease
MKRSVVVLGIIASLMAIGWIGMQESPYLQLSRATELFGTIVREIHEQYIQEIPPEELVDEAIDHMLSKLDPYTDFYREEKTSDLDFLLRGHYIGVGIRLGTIDSMLTVITVADGSSAHRNGVRVGDVLLKIDSIPMTNPDPEYARKYLRGAVGSSLRLVLRRGDDTLAITLEREELIVRNVTYAELLRGGIGVIRLERFSRRAPEEFRLALDSLRELQPLRGLIIDLRDNPGGLLDAAVSIAEMFLRGGDTIVVTKNRNGSNVRAYVARGMPYVDTTLPLIVMVNNRSASASEILAGALQDNDRAIIVGDTTVGKGLVQTVVSLPYNAALKLTTARYYTPSGRSIQQVEGFCPSCWIHRGLDSEKLQTYRTIRFRRPIRSGMGIIPDTILVSVDKDSIPAAIGRMVIWNFATRYTSRMSSPPAVIDTTTVLPAFFRYLDESQPEATSVQGRANALALQAQRDGWGARSIEHIDRLVQLLRAERKRIAREHSKQLAYVLELETRSRFCSDVQQVRLAEQSDAAVQTAAQMLRSSSFQKFFLTSHGIER